MSNSAMLRTAACQAPLSMGFSRQDYWSGLSCPPPGDLTDAGIEPTALTSPALAGRFFTFLIKEALVYGKGEAISLSVIEKRRREENDQGENP